MAKWRNFNHAGSVCTPKTDPALAPGMARAGRPARSPEAARYPRVARTCDGGAAFQPPSWSGRPVRDIAGPCPRPASRPAVFPIP